MVSPILHQKLKTLPRVPGIYRFYNSEGKIIYIGKAKNLKSRVSSYFRNNIDKRTKTYKLVSEIYDLKLIEVLSEFEALILEAELIKQHKPKYNIALKDDKSYIYIVIRSDKISLRSRKIKIPRVITARKADLIKTDTFFGPYPNASTTKYVLRTLRKSFAFRDCSVAKFNRYTKLQKPCLYGHMGLCQAPCTDLSPGVYKKDITRLKRLLGGGSVSFIKSLEKEMKNASQRHDYELAAKYRDLLQKYNYVRRSFKMPARYIENPYLVEDLITQALDSLIKNIPSITTIPRRIECYDISTVSGKDAVGSMVVALDGRIMKKEYRKFKIRLKDTPDDFGMMQEVLCRRLKREFKKSTRWGMPDLIVLDGGKGQLSAVRAVMNTLDLFVPLVGLTKRFETLVFFEDAVFKEVTLPRSDEGLKLLIRLRDEAHRFAQRYHHQLRLQSLNR